jgi:hypothetical protein
MLATDQPAAFLALTIAMIGDPAIRDQGEAVRVAILTSQYLFVLIVLSAPSHSAVILGTPLMSLILISYSVTAEEWISVVAGHVIRTCLVVVGVVRDVEAGASCSGEAATVIYNAAVATPSPITLTAITLK